MLIKGKRMKGRYQSGIISCGFYLGVSFFIGACASTPKINSDAASTGKACVELPLTLRWTPPKDQVDQDQILRPTQGYKVYLKPAESKVYSEYINVGNVTEYQIDHLKKGTTYQLKVVAYNESGEGKPSTPVSREICE